MYGEISCSCISTQRPRVEPGMSLASLSNYSPGWHEGMECARAVALAMHATLPLKLRAVSCELL